MDPVTTVFIVSACVSALVIIGISLFLKRGRPPGANDIPSGPVTIGI